MIDLVNEMLNKSKELDERINQMRKWGQEKAKKEYDYQITKNQEIMKLKDLGYPATQINELVKGQPDVAKKRLDRDVAEVMYDTCIESINVLKLQTRLLDNQVNKEWGQAK